MSLGSPRAVARTRIAPTPSGYLHVGNAANALVTSWWAHSRGAEIHLRMDDLDSDRVRPEYIEDIVGLLNWLDIDWTSGPRSLSDAVVERSGRIGRCREALAAALAVGIPAYACSCSRRELQGVPTGGCPAGCRDRNRDLVPHETALRLAVEPGTVIRVDGEEVDLAAALGDFVIWRRDDLPAYQLASVVEDSHHAITHILRGRDLIESTAAQLHLAALMGLPHAREADVRHHALILDDTGRKLSKSQLGRSHGLPRTTDTRAQILRFARVLADDVGIPRPPR